jgi:ATP/maltotriose-dependent transcriptional regulator MalT
VQFVARQEELAEMHRLLHGENSRSIIVLHGLGGIGKTQLAIKYLKRHKAKYTAIFWINASDQDSLKLSFVEVARQILRNFPQATGLACVESESSLDNVVDAVKGWLRIRTNTRWLIIYDNYDNPKLPNGTDRTAINIRLFLPECDHGSIIITTRSAQVTIGPRIHVQKMRDILDGLEILSNTSGRKDIKTGKTFLVS